MLKIIFLLVVISAARNQARPSYLHGSSSTTLLPSYETLEYAPTVVGHSYESVPTAISHQSATVVHEKRPYWRPIVDHAPLLKTYSPELSYGTAPALSYGVAPIINYGSDWYNGWSNYPSSYPRSYPTTYPSSYPGIYLK